MTKQKKHKVKGKHESKINQNKAYKAENREQKNKVLKLTRLLKKQPNNSVIADRIKELTNS